MASRGALASTLIETPLQAVHSQSTGDKNFLRTYYQLAAATGNSDAFHSTHLAPLFFEALNTERPGQVFPLTGTRMPYLNGGLFEPDPPALQSLDLDGP